MLSPRRALLRSAKTRGEVAERPDEREFVGSSVRIRRPRASAGQNPTYRGDPDAERPELCLQVLRSVVQVWRASAERRGMLLRACLHLRTVVRLSCFVRLRRTSRAVEALTTATARACASRSVLPYLGADASRGPSHRGSTTRIRPSMSADRAPARAARARGLLAAAQRLGRHVALLLLLLLPLQTSGVMHLVIDATRTLAGRSLHGDAAPCSHEEDGERCPPDCPDCHCVPAVPALLPVTPSVLLRRLAFETSEGRPSAASPSPRPLLQGLERPPRGVRSFA